MLPRAVTSHRPRRPHAALALLLAAAAALASCTGSEERSDRAAATSADRPAVSSVRPAPPEGLPDGWQPAPLVWGGCTLPIDGECATLTVPLDWSRPEGPTLDLAVGRVPATGPSPIGPLLTNPGGPGASGLEFLSYGPVSPTLGERFDLVSWDPRGVGESTAVRCGDGVDELLALDPAPDDAAEQRELDDAARALSDECARTDGDLLPHLGTEDVARDVEALRRALGSPTLDYLGFSYGTHIGLRYAEMFPEKVRAMVLDGVVDPAQGFEEFLLGQTAAFDDAFERNARACAAAGAPACGVDDLAAAYDRVAATVEGDPLPAEDGSAGPAELATAAIQTSYVPDGWRQLGPALAAAERGDGTPLGALAADYYGFGGFTAYAAVVCTDTPPPSGAAAYREFADRARELSPRFGGSVANELASCATWPAEPVGTASAVIAAGAPPILVVGNTGDAATPLENARAVARSLTRGVLVTVELDGHTAYGADLCATDIVDRYLVELELPPEGTTCP